ncbi:MAG: peptide deformylase [Thermodesulfobacteriota bacterium]
MALKEIIKHPHPTLRKKTKPVTEFDGKLAELVRDMAETMYNAPGVGLAAPQINISLSLAIVDLGEEEENKLITLVNPEILKAEGSQVDEEGCLSIVDFRAKVKRYKKISVKAKDLSGNTIEFEAEDWPARVIQHEVDHLNGRLFIDHLSSLKRSLYKKQRKKQLASLEKDSGLAKSA